LLPLKFGTTFNFVNKNVKLCYIIVITCTNSMYTFTFTNITDNNG